MLTQKTVVKRYRVSKKRLRRLRDAAASRGDAYFDALEPCAQGHCNLRRTSDFKCMECIRCKHRKRLQRVDVSEKNRERAQRWRELNRDRDRANALKWHFANHEKAKARSAAWRANNKEKHIKNARDWYLTHPLQARVARRNYEVRRRGAAGVFSRKDVNAMLAAQNRKCAYCERSLDGSGYHIDHIIPLSRGGTNYSDNLQLTCPQCNMRKRNKSHDDFVREIRKASLWQL